MFENHYLGNVYTIHWYKVSSWIDSQSILPMHFDNIPVCFSELLRVTSVEYSGYAFNKYAPEHPSKYTKTEPIRYAINFCNGI